MTTQFKQLSTSRLLNTDISIAYPPNGQDKNDKTVNKDPGIKFVKINPCWPDTVSCQIEILIGMTPSLHTSYKSHWSCFHDAVLPTCQMSNFFAVLVSKGILRFKSFLECCIFCRIILLEVGGKAKVFQYALNIKLSRFYTENNVTSYKKI